MRLAWFSPLPPRRSGIADYSRELLPELRAAGADIDLWVAASEPEPRGLEGFRRVRYARADSNLARLASYDALVYHFGNDAEYHTDLFDCFCRFPGIVVLHDLVLHHFLFQFLRRHGTAQDYARELESVYGEAGRAFARRAVVEPTAALSTVDAEHFPLRERILDVAPGVIVHSDQARRLVRSRWPDLAVAKIHHFGPPLAASPDPAALRRRYGLPEKAVVVASFGHFVAAKRIGVALEAIAALGFLRRRRVHYLLVGEPGDGPLRRARELGLADRVQFVSWVDLEVMNDYLRMTDVVINLRHPSMGETSGVACRALAAGKPCVVSDAGWFRELPDDVVVKIGVGRGEPLELAAALRRLVDRPAARRELGARALRFSLDRHSPRQAARDYLEFLSARAATPEPLSLALHAEIAAVLASWGLQAGDSAALSGIGAALDRLFPRPAAPGSG